MDIHVLTLKMIETALEQEELDLGFTVVLGNELASNRFMRRLIHKSPLCFLLPSNHPFAGETSIDISALAKDSFIVLSETESQEGFNWFMNFCAKREFLPNIASKTERMEIIFWQVEAGIGISFMPKDPILVQRIHPSISLVDMQGEDAYSNIMATWKREHCNPAIPLFLKVLETIDINQQNDVK
jgi:DNA-binding transcriptional LysR family regulator